MLTDSEYAELRRKVDAQNAYWAGRTMLTAEESAARPYPEIGNTERSQIEVFEFHRDKPERFTAYVTAGTVTTFTGDRLGTIIRRGAEFRRGGYLSDKKQYVRVRSDWGTVYVGLSNGDGLYINLRKAARRKGGA